MDQKTQTILKARTIVKDAAMLFKQKKLTEQEISKMDKGFLEEVKAYAVQITDEEEVIEIKRKPKEEEVDLLKGYIPTKPKSAAERAQKAETEKKEEVINVSKPQPQPEPQPEPKVAPPPPPVQPQPVFKVENPKKEEPTKEEGLRMQLESFDIKKKQIIDVLQSLTKEKTALEKTLEEIKLKEKEKEIAESNLRSEEKNLPVTATRDIEKRRWETEDARQVLERERFETHSKLSELEIKITQKTKEKNAVEQEEIKVQIELKRIQLKKEAEAAGKKLEEEEKNYLAIQIRKKKYEMDWTRIKEEIKNLKKGTESTDEEVLKIKNGIDEISKEEESAVSEELRHKVEEKRWELEKRLRDIEQAAWKADEEVDVKNKEIEAIEKVFADIQIEEEGSKDKIRKYKQVIKSFNDLA